MAADERKHAQEQLAYLNLLLKVHTQVSAKTDAIHKQKLNDAAAALIDYLEHEVRKILTYETYRIKQ